MLIGLEESGRYVEPVKNADWKPHCRQGRAVLVLEQNSPLATSWVSSFSILLGKAHQTIKFTLPLSFRCDVTTNEKLMAKTLFFQAMLKFYITNQLICGRVT